MYIDLEDEFILVNCLRYCNFPPNQTEMWKRASFVCVTIPLLSSQVLINESTSFTVNLCKQKMNVSILRTGHTAVAIMIGGKNRHMLH